MKRLIQLALIAFYLVLSSCSEDNSTNPSKTDWVKWMNMKVGNYYNYDDLFYNFLGGTILAYYNRKNEIINTANYLGKECVMGACTQGAQIILNYYSTVQDSKLFYSGHIYTLNFIFGNNYNPISPECWIQTADFEKDTWVGYDTSFTNAAVDYDKYWTGELHIHGQKGADITLSINGVDYKCKTIIEYADYSGKITYNGNDYPFGNP